MTARIVRDEALGVAFSLDERLVDVGFASDEESPSAHFIASVPDDGWIAALALVSVASEPAPGEDWLARELMRARASFGTWSPAAHEMLVAPEAATLAGRPAIHVRYLLTGRDAEGEAAGDGAAGTASDDTGPVPVSFVEHWTVLVGERRWLLAMELMVQPPQWWDRERDALELPFRTLELI